MRPDWAVGFEDETWWSRVTAPAVHAWAERGKPLRLFEQSLAKDDTDPKALACYGLLVSCPGEPTAVPEQVWVRFVNGHPVSGVTTQFLDWCCTGLQEAGKRVLILIWDNASWHISGEVRRWIRTHNRQVKQESQGVRIIACRLPTKSPWLNPLEPRWVHGKRCVVEPARLLTASQLAHRVCVHFGCHDEPYLTAPEKVA